MPYDLLFLHLVLPPSIEYIRPRRRLQKAWNYWWRISTAAFRLTSLLRQPRRYPGMRLPVDNAPQRGWWMLDKVLQLVFGRYDNAQTAARVPAADQTVLLPPAERKNGGVFIPLDSSGVPCNPDDKLRLLKQDRAAREAGRDPAHDYTVVTLERYWRTRIHAFIGFTVTTVAAAIAVGFLVPLVVGRAALGFVVGETTHDGYNIVSRQCLDLLR